MKEMCSCGHGRASVSHGLGVVPRALAGRRVVRFLGDAPRERDDVVCRVSDDDRVSGRQQVLLVSLELVAAASRRDLVADGPAPDVVVPLPEGRASYGAEGGARDGEELLMLCYGSGPVY